MDFDIYEAPRADARGIFSFFGGIRRSSNSHSSSDLRPRFSAKADKIEGFEWDQGNIEKNKLKHNVNKEECEEVFFNQPLRIFDDEIHSGVEKRYGALGKTNKERHLAVFFTIRDNKIRVISAHDQGKKDRRIYKNIEEQYKKKEG